MLLLFDIDGTLLLAADAHRDALLAALHDVLEIPDPAAANVPAAGRTDVEIAREIALPAGSRRSASTKAPVSCARPAAASSRDAARPSCRQMSRPA